MNDRLEKHIGVLDGIRSFSILLLVWFHIWEQCWLTPYIEYNNVITRYFGITQSDLHTLVRFGYLWVDALIVISAIVNFLPYARSILGYEDWPDTKTFYKKRAIRILPNYFLCILIMFFVALFDGAYKAKGTGFAILDVITHLTFTSNFFKSVYRLTELNGALWTVQVEVIWYILMPFIAKLIKKKPKTTLSAMILIGLVSSNFLIYHASDLWAVNNFFLTFAVDYAVGIIICFAYYAVFSRDLDNTYINLAGILMALGSFIALLSVINHQYDVDRPWGQLYYRTELALLFGGLIFGFMLAPSCIRKFMGSKFFVFVSTISYNLYIWHQVIATWLKKLKIPYWSGDTDPSYLTDNIAWKRSYFFVALIVSIAISTILTYFYEKPISRALTKKFLKKNNKERELSLNDGEKEE